MGISNTKRCVCAIPKGIVIEKTINLSQSFARKKISTDYITATSCGTKTSETDTPKPIYFLQNFMFLLSNGNYEVHRNLFGASKLGPLNTHYADDKD